MAISKREQVEKFVQKGPEWLAGKLYDARKELAAERAKRRKVEMEGHSTYTLEEINHNLSVLLQNAGITTTPLIVQYIEPDCINCPHWNNYEDCCEYFGECVGEKKLSSYTKFMYTFNVSHEEVAGIMSGIDSKFRSFTEECVIRVIDNRTGNVIWENTEEEGEE